MEGSEDIMLKESDISAMDKVMSFSVGSSIVELVKGDEAYVVVQRSSVDPGTMLVYGLAYDRKFAEILFEAVSDEIRLREKSRERLNIS